MKIVYICDHLACPDSECRIDPYYPCQRTLDPAHAMNGACEDPWDYPERFELCDDITSEHIYWEKD